LTYRLESVTPQTTTGNTTPCEQWAVTLAADAEGLPMGDAQAELLIRAVGLQQTVPVSITVGAPLSVRPSKLFFSDVAVGKKMELSLDLLFDKSISRGAEPQLVLSKGLDKHLSVTLSAGPAVPATGAEVPASTTEAAAPELAAAPAGDAGGARNVGVAGDGAEGVAIRRKLTAVWTGNEIGIFTGTLSLVFDKGTTIPKVVIPVVANVH